MLLDINLTEKSFGDKTLYRDLHFSVQAGEKVGLIGRNGTGKSTLIHIVTGDDTDYEGEVMLKRGAIVVVSRQEHHGLDDKTVLEYLQGDLPEYAELAHILDTYPEHMGESDAKMQRYSDALERFGQLGYFELEEELKQLLADYQLGESKLHARLGDLSGGQKRLVELIKVQRARGDIALIDEPTNHMDYVAKAAFVKWLKAAQESVLVITHDRDVLREVDRIVEIRDGRAYTFRGNYDAYLRSNTSNITSQVNEYDVTQRRIANLREDITRFKRLKEKARDPGTIHRFKSQQHRAETELEKLSVQEKPSFWIDQESASELNDKLTASYEKYKTKNIRVTARTADTKSSRLLVQVDKLSLGYDEKPLFEGVSFELREGERVRLHGRNGAGKTTLVQAIMSTVEARPLESHRFAGRISTEKELQLGLYEQEIHERYLPMTLHDAIEHTLMDKGQQASEQRIKQLLADYLFNPQTDGAMPVSLLSGGQKARFQLIAMLANDPLILILDEPTNHLDLPSIEELEAALKQYRGAILYISHDSYFAEKLGGAVVDLGAQSQNADAK